MSNVLVTGGLGFIGSHLVDQLVGQSDSVDVIDAQKMGSDIRNCNQKVRYFNIDLSNKKVIDEFFEKAPHYDRIFHLAAESHVDRAIKDPQPFIDSNITGTYNLFNALVNKYKQTLDFAKPKILLFSTDEVMGELETGSFKEDDPALAKNMYSMTKLAQEGIARSYYHSDKLQVVTSRCSNIYGPRQFPEKLLPVIINSALSNSSIPVYGDGKQVREWTHVSDAVDSAIFVMENGEINNTYHIGSAIEKQNIEVIRYVLKEMSKDESLISHVADRKGHDKRYSLCVDKVNKMGWKAKVGFEEGIKETIEWYKKNQR